MPKITVHGHRPACLGTLQALNTLRSHVATRSYQALPSSGPTAPEATVKKINLGFIKLKIHPSRAEIALREQARKLAEKATPYPSKHGFSWVELNCQVRVTPSESSVLDSEPVVCRHLATMFAMHAGKKSELMPLLSTEEGITQVFGGKLTKTHIAFLRAVRKTPPGCKHMVNSEQLGAYLKAIAMQLQARGTEAGPSQANSLLITAGHVMALHVERKSKNGVGYFSAKLYDPNDTANYRRVVKVTPEDFGSLKLKDMVIRPQLIDHYAFGENKCLSMVAISLDHRLQALMDISATTASAENMYVALAYGLRGEVQSMLKTALGGSYAPNELIELLGANFSIDGMTISGLHKAFNYGHADVVKVFSQEVLRSHLSQRAKVDLLAANRSDGVPGLYMALQNGHTAAVRLFAQEVLGSSRLSEKAKVYLLASRCSDGVPGLFVALHHGHCDAVKAFAQEVLGSNLSEQAMVGLMAAKLSNGKSGLSFALKQGQSDAVKALIDEIAASSLSQEAKDKLLPGVYRSHPTRARPR